MGLAMLETIDDTRFSVSLTEMDEETAKALLEKKEIAAYFVFPAGFADAAMAGEIKSIRAVFSRQSGELTLLLKEELTGVVSELLTVSQKGAYGAERAADALGGRVTPYEALNDMVLRYTGLILRRGGTYTVNEVGITPDDTPDGAGLSFAATFVLSFFVFFLLLCALPLAGVYIRRDRSLAGQLSAAGIGAGKQTVCRFAALALCLLLLLLLLSLLTGAAFAIYTGVENAGKPGDSADGGINTGNGIAARWRVRYRSGNFRRRSRSVSPCGEAVLRVFAVGSPCGGIQSAAVFPRGGCAERDPAAFLYDPHALLSLRLLLSPLRFSGEYAKGGASAAALCSAELSCFGPPGGSGGGLKKSRRRSAVYRPFSPCDGGGRPQGKKIIRRTADPGLHKCEKGFRLKNRFCCAVHRSA